MCKKLQDRAKLETQKLYTMTNSILNKKTMTNSVSFCNLLLRMHCFMMQIMPYTNQINPEFSCTYSTDHLENPKASILSKLDSQK